MSFAPGARLGPYEIVGTLGQGGMAEVYRARDTRLGRDVAIKVASEQFSDRFAREARAVASLNHPNICTLYDVGPDYLVMELVDGPTLGEHLTRTGPLPVAAALRIMQQVADALDAAHAQGIVHRDLKPANVKIKSDGTVKVLDFGLAKHVTSSSGAESVELTAMRDQATREGLIVGTTAYMAPEQTRGEALDTRVDVWAFGVVLLELVTGASPFARPTTADTVAAVLHHEPDVSRAPDTLRRLIRTCLEKDPSKRLRHIADARLLIDDESRIPTDSRLPNPDSRRASPPWPWLIAGAAVAALAVVLALWSPWREEALDAPPVSFQFTPSALLPPSGNVTVSPDGRHLVYPGIGSDSVTRLWIRDLATLAERPLVGTELRLAAAPAWWSPDSQAVAFDAGGVLKRTDVAGGLPQTICDLASFAIGGTWARDGTILFGTVDAGIMRVPASGGSPSPVTILDAARRDDAHLVPTFLPDGRHFLYLRASRRNPENTGIFVGSLDVKPEEQDRARLIASTTGPAYAPASDGTLGRILFVRDGNLLAQSFDDRRLGLVAAPIVVAERVGSFRDTMMASAAGSDTLVYRAADEEMTLVWMNRQGTLTGQLKEHGLFASVDLSPDGSRAVVTQVLPQTGGGAELWLFDVDRAVSSRLATIAIGDDVVWSGDGEQVLYSSRSERNTLFRRSVAGGAPTALVESPLPKTPTSWSRDGRFVLYTEVDPKTNTDLWLLSLEGEPRATPFLKTDAAESQAQFSPVQSNGVRWVAYTSNSSGRSEVYLRTFPDSGRQEIASREGGHSPRWRADGKELFYVAADRSIVAVDVGDIGQRPGAPRKLFVAPTGFGSRDATGSRSRAPWAVTPDGERFLFATPAGQGAQIPFTVVLNWPATLKK